MRYAFAFGLLVVVVVCASLVAAEKNRSVDFSNDPGWDSYRNRLLPDPVPKARQDFGYRNSHHAGGEAAGEIGGWIQRSATSAFYAKPIARRTLDDKMTASGKFAVTNCQNGSGCMFGWFKDPIRGWRTPNSLVLRIDGNGGKYWMLFEYGTQHWLTGGRGCFDGIYQTTKTKPFLSDGTVHNWTLSYDPAANDNQGEVTLVLDGTTYPLPLAAGHKADGAEFDHFGLFNTQLQGKGLEVYFDDVILDGKAEHFDSDPKWQGFQNEGEFPQQFLRPLQNFGYSPTNFTAAAKGEIGGALWRDPKGAYYADRVGPFTLDDELSASGRVVMTRGSSDSGACFGFFDSDSRKRETNTAKESASKNVLGICIEGPSRIGHYFRPFYTTFTGEGNSRDQGPVIRPDSESHRWALHYDPRGADGLGQITVQFDDERQTLDLKPGHKQLGATFNRFGMFAFDSADGGFLEYYLDDLTYSAEK